ASSVQSATFIQSALKAAGINITINQMTDADYNTALGARKLQMFLGEWYSWGEDPIYQMNFLLKSTAFTDYAGYSNPKFDALVTRGINMTDLAARDNLSQQAQQMAIDAAPWAFLYTRDSVIVANPNVSGVTRPDDQYPRFQYLILK
ncbi:MAG: peptide transporter substrate-binding protein, partial [Pseudonocardiales bacterium]|nr:peptide transporter substrate-binding protein [Pseudonocardiales bacterium]